MPEDTLKVAIEPVGPDAATLSALSRAVLEQGPAGPLLRQTRHQLLSFDLLDAEAGAKPARAPAAPTRYRATVYDQTNSRTLMIEGPLNDPAGGVVSEYGSQPLPAEEEFQQAVRIVTQSRELGPDFRQKRLETYQPMPPLIETELPDGRTERVVTVGLRAPNGGPRHQIVGVHLAQGRVITDLRNALVPVAFRSDDQCGPPSNTRCSSPGTAQRARVRVTRGRTTLWTFTVVRPANSSGTNGSGIELRHVHYRGKQVLYRAHVPILNVEYFSDGIGAGCGPTYRDWQNAETCFQADGTDPVPGFRLCASPARTILDSGSDAGNFRGVALYVQGQEVVLVSELTAGWYRYISEWRLHADGTIRPRFGFTATDNPCTCKRHHHHAYWRFDFDIRTAGNNRVEEFNDPPLVGGANWHTKKYEIRRPGDAGRKRRWRISNTTSGEGYELIPGANDGTASAYGVGDVWVLRYNGSEIDDGQGFTTDPALSRANIDKFRSPAQAVDNQDIVVWYAGHFLHDSHAGEEGGGHIVGPELRPFNW